MTTSAGADRFNSPDLLRRPAGREKRDNEDILLKGTYFLSTKSLGSHNIVFGYDDFSGQALSEQLPVGTTSYSSTRPDGIIQRTDVFPIIDSSSYLVYWPILQQLPGSDVRTYSLLRERLLAPQQQPLVQRRRPVRQEQRQGQPRLVGVGRLGLQPPPRRDLGRQGGRPAAASARATPGTSAPSRRTSSARASSAGSPAIYVLLLRGDRRSTTATRRTRSPRQPGPRADVPLVRHHGHRTSSRRAGIEPIYVYGPGRQRPDPREPQVDLHRRVRARASRARSAPAATSGSTASTASSATSSRRRTDTTTGTRSPTQLGYEYDLALVRTRTPSSGSTSASSLQATYRLFDSLNLGGELHLVAHLRQRHGETATPARVRSGTSPTPSTSTPPGTIPTGTPAAGPAPPRPRLRDVRRSPPEGPRRPELQRAPARTTPDRPTAPWAPSTRGRT